MSDLRSLVTALALACATLLPGCSGDTPEPGSGPAASASSTPAEGTCPIITSSELDAIVGTDMTDHYERTPQGRSPLGASAVACDFDSGEGRTAKVLVAEGSTSSFDGILEKAGASSAKCPAVRGIGDKAVSCSGAGEATVIAVAGDRVVVAYRGGEPGGDALLAEATDIAKLVVGGGN